MHIRKATQGEESSAPSF